MVRMLRFADSLFRSSRPNCQLSVAAPCTRHSNNAMPMEVGHLQSFFTSQNVEFWIFLTGQTLIVLHANTKHEDKPRRSV